MAVQPRRQWNLLPGEGGDAIQRCRMFSAAGVQVQTGCRKSHSGPTVRSTWTCRAVCRGVAVRDEAQFFSNSLSELVLSVKMGERRSLRCTLVVTRPSWNERVAAWSRRGSSPISPTAGRPPRKRLTHRRPSLIQKSQSCLFISRERTLAYALNYSSKSENIVLLRWLVLSVLWH